MTNLCRKIVLTGMLFLLGCLGQPLAADLLVLNSGEKVFGVVKKMEGETVQFLPLPGNERFATDFSEARSFKRSEIKVLIRNFDEPRLEELRPEQLEPYQLYAEELLPQVADPIAHRLCLRLVLIVAYHSKPNSSLRRWAVNCLLQLSRSKEEALRFRALKALDDRRGADRTALSVRGAVGEREVVEMKRLLSAIRKSEQEKASSSIRFFLENGYPPKWDSRLSLGELKNMSQKTRLSPRELLRVLEFGQLLDGLAEDERRSNSDWSDLSQDAYRGWDEIPSFENVTEFDPVRSVFRNGNWTVPAGAVKGGTGKK